MSAPAPGPWWRDRHLAALVAATIGLRGLVLALWPMERCVRDECMYLFTAGRMAKGLGMTASNGWIWAPAHIFVLSLVERLTGWAELTRIPQVLLTGVAVVYLVRLGRRVVGERGALVAGWLYALHPTLIFFATRLWSETVYATLLLLALEQLMLAREERCGRALATGVLVGVCVLLRGVATYMLPIFALGLLWDRWRLRQAWLQVGILGAAAVLTVAPYSAYATHKFGAFILSDRTMGQMMWLGDNDFPPITFDAGNGQLSDDDYDRTTGLGREHCAPKDEPIARDICETANGKAWIRAHPREFLRRVPLRLAQLFNPNSFLTRHLRTGGWKHLPRVVDEALCWAVVLASFLTVLGAAAGAWAARRTPYLLVIALTTAYHLAAIAALAGLSRYRVPLDILWLPYAGLFLAAPRAGLRAIGRSWWRLLGLLLTLGLLLWLMLWFLPAGFPWWKDEYPLWSGWFA
ncbi:MAG: glycosyltransferase family 39 protein [Pseudomonadota bacterium]